MYVYKGLNDPNKKEFLLEELLTFCSTNPSIIKTLLRIQVISMFAYIYLFIYVYFLL